MTTKRCKIHYRRLRREKGFFPAESLSATIAKALQQLGPDGRRIGANVRHRLASVPGNEDSQRVVNNHHADEISVFADLCIFSPGKLQAVLAMAAEEHQTLEEALEAFGVAEQAAPQGSEYLHGISYWLAIGDHVYHIAHSSLPSKALEEYLTWLLRDKAAVIAPDQFVELVSEFDRSQIGGDLGDIRSIEIGGFVPETMREAPVEPSRERVVDVEERATIGDRVARGFAAARRILEDMVGSVEAQRIIERVPPDAALEVRVNIGYRATKRRIEKEFMKNLASGLRNMADGEVRVRSKDGTVKGDDARLSADMGIRRISPLSNLLELEHAREQMIETHRRFLHDGKIQP